MTYDNTPDASAQAIRRSLQQWLRIEIGKGHPQELIEEVIQQWAEEIALGDPQKPVLVGRSFIDALEAQERALEAWQLKGSENGNN